MYFTIVTEYIFKNGRYVVDSSREDEESFSVDQCCQLYIFYQKFRKFYQMTLTKFYFSQINLLQFLLYQIFSPKNKI